MNTTANYWADRGVEAAGDDARAGHLGVGWTDAELAQGVSAHCAEDLETVEREHGTEARAAAEAALRTAYVRRVRTLAKMKG